MKHTFIAVLQSVAPLTLAVKLPQTSLRQTCFLIHRSGKCRLKVGNVKRSPCSAITVFMSALMQVYRYEGGSLLKSKNRQTWKPRPSASEHPSSPSGSVRITSLRTNVQGRGSFHISLFFFFLNIQFS